jgi:hypothetical protein
MATVLDLIWVGGQQLFFGKSERKDSTALPPDGQIKGPSRRSNHTVISRVEPNVSNIAH